MKFIWCVPILMFLLISSSVLADEITLDDGTVIKGKIILVNEEVVKFTPEGKAYFIEVQKKQVRKITYENTLVDDTKKTDKTEPEKKEVVDHKSHYPVFGITFPGTPAGINLVFGYYSRWVGFHISGGYLGKNLYGGQFNLLFSFYNSRNLLFGMALVGGVSHFTLRRDNPKNWYYGGLAYNMNIYGFFFELGLTAGKGDFTNPQVILQIGYVHRFNRV